MKKQSVNVKPKPSPETQENPDITVRKPNWDFKDVPIHWMNDDPHGTHFINALHIIFPEGERFFIRSVNAYKNQIKDPILLRDIKGFMQQEAQHGRVHEQFWDTLRAQGLDPDGFAKRYHKIAYEKIEAWINRRFGPIVALATTAGLEHYTASLAQATFESGSLERPMPQPMRELMYWHACEEIEHKAVAFDVFKSVGGGYFTRILGFILGTMLLFVFSHMGAKYFAKRDTELKKFGRWKAFKRIFTSGGLKILLYMPKHVAAYFRPGFHPNDMDNRNLATEWFSKHGNFPTLA